MVNTSYNINSSTGNHNSSQEQLGKPNRISNWIAEHKVFVTLGATLATATAVAFTAAVYEMVPMTLPIVLGGSLVIASMIYLISCGVSSYRKKLEVRQVAFETKQVEQVIEESLETAAKSKHIHEPVVKKELRTEKEKEEALKKLNETFEDLAQDIRSNPLMEDTKLNEKIAKYFEGFKVALDPSVQEQKQAEYIKVINQILVQQELRKKKLVTERIDRECEILEWLGIQKDQLAVYGDKELMYRLALHFVQSDTTELDSKMPLREVIGQKIKERALKVRLETVEITGKKVEKFSALMEFDAAVREKVVPQVEDLKIDLPDYLDHTKHPKVIKEFEKHFEIAKEVVISIGAKNFIRSGVAKFKDDKYSLEKFEEVLKNKQQTIVSCIVRAVAKEAGERSLYLASDREFYKKWIGFMEIETVQGSDENAVLGTGVCYTINARVEKASQQNPNLSPQELNAGEILGSDRKNHAAYRINALLAHNEAHPDEIELAKSIYNIKQKQTFNAEMDSYIEETLTQSKGWVGLAIHPKEGGVGHIISMRLDIGLNKVWLFDSNYGLFKFEDGVRTFEQAKTLCYECFGDLMVGAYQELPSVRIVQRVFKSNILDPKALRLCAFAFK